MIQGENYVRIDRESALQNRELEIYPHNIYQEEKDFTTNERTRHSADNKTQKNTQHFY